MHHLTGLYNRNEPSWFTIALALPVHHPATTHDAAAAIVAVVADESLDLQLDYSSQRTFTTRAPPRPGIDSLAVISTRTCRHVWTVYLF